MSLLYWDKFLKEGDILFNYMVNNFEAMFDSDMYIKHFEIRDTAMYRLDTEEIKKTYSRDIEKNLIPWIKNEFQSNRLFQKELWKPFREPEHFNYMYFGYRVLFHFKAYYFQLTIEDGCNLDECKYCCNIKNNKCFSLALYGWKEDTTNLLQPYNKVIILSDNMMPELDWKHQ